MQFDYNGITNAVGDPYSLEAISGAGSNLSLTITNASGRDQLRRSWGQ